MVSLGEINEIKTSSIPGSLVEERRRPGDEVRNKDSNSLLTIRI